jgi:hypothetical protein
MRPFSAILPPAKDADDSSAFNPHGVRVGSKAGKFDLVHGRNAPFHLALLHFCIVTIPGPYYSWAIFLQARRQNT